MTADHAYDLTLAKFLNLPESRNGGLETQDIEGPDCRYYYDAFCTHATQGLQDQPPNNAINEDLLAADLLQKLVTRHFYLSCLECRRRALKLVRRYRWKTNGDSLVVWLPVEMTGRRCRTWLEANIPDVVPGQPGERERVQGIVDRLLARRRVLSLDRLGQFEMQVGAEHGWPGSIGFDEVSVHGLAAVVADEKSENLDAQRPSIRALGGPTVKRLVETVFGSLVSDGYRAETIARTFGLSKASFSRFAGCHWTRDGGISGERVIPDLWRNTAQMLATREEFAAVARQAGVWNQVRRIVGPTDYEGGDVE